MDSAVSTQPVQLEFTYPEISKRFWAIPVIGFIAKLIVLIPHLVVLSLLGIVVYLLQLVLWIPVLFTGKYPDWGYNLVGGTAGWAVRVNCYLYGLTDVYPPFALSSPTLPDSTGYPVVFSLVPAEQATRWCAIPIVGLVVKMILLIPHILVLYALGIVAEVILLIAWAPVLFTGVYPVWARDLMSGYLRWSIRMQSYFLGLTDRYPPFQLGS